MLIPWNYLHVTKEFLPKEHASRLFYFLTRIMIMHITHVGSSYINHIINKMNK